MSTKKLFIDGSWVDAISKKTRDIINPANEEIIAQTAEAGIEDARLAIAAAKRSFYETGEWRRMSASKRATVLFNIANAIEEEIDEFSRLDSIDSGKPLREAEGDVGDAIDCFRYYAGLITKPNGVSYDVNDNFGPIQSFTVSEPIGVCALITPWNYPLLMSVWKLAPALAAGNSIVSKPSPLAPLTTIKLFEVFEKCGLPKGVANLLLGAGEEAGGELAKSDDVDKIAFTGSTATGRKIAQAATGNLKKVSLELGGKSPNIIFADADLEGAVEWAMIGIFFNQGEVCSAGSRIIIEESFKDKFVKRLVERANAMTIGVGLDNPDIGAIISRDQMEKILKYIETGKQEGATCLCGGEQYVEGDCAKGYFIRPTIFDNCTADMTIVKEEIFGPVVTIQTFKTEEEAIEKANDTIYGLAGGVFTNDSARALRVIREIRAGITWINCYNPTFNEAPWGGYKMSGNSRELGIWGLQAYQEVKQINIHLAPGAIGWYEN